MKELDRMKQDFVSGTTHEFRSPLGIIESHATVVLQDLEVVKESLKIIAATGYPA